MVLKIFPTSPVPADMTRSRTWNANKQTFDSGAYQGSSPYSKPLYRYGFNMANMPRTKQQSLESFINDLRDVEPFVFSDPYDNRINGVVCVRTGTAVRSFFVTTSEGWAYIPVSGTLLITSNLSGALTQGTHYQFNPDTGVFSTWVAPSSSDFWTASCQYFRKCVTDNYDLNSKIWNQFNAQISFTEIALP
jgi:hypothetical protein